MADQEDEAVAELGMALELFERKGHLAGAEKARISVLPGDGAL
ncbi:MAG TPA: hypothetical protein VGO32_06935 [Candidatus Limnocylindria bacterium]|jgi:hypothetical protein|nr:hypothetical protein [Candidatus Limnocylindria bacterium]